MKKIPVLVLCLSICAFICAFTAYFLSDLRDKLTYVPPVASLESVETGYILTLSEGFVAIRRIGEDSPCRVYGTPENMLSEYDKAMLREGVYCNTLKDAENAAADFIG